MRERLFLFIRKFHGFCHGGQASRLSFFLSLQDEFYLSVDPRRRSLCELASGYNPNGFQPKRFPRGSMKMLTAPPNHRVFTLQEIQKHRRCVISVTPCEASNASGAWGVRTKQSRAAGTTHLLPDALAAQWNGLASLIKTTKTVEII